MNRWLRRAGVMALVLIAAPGARAQSSHPLPIPPPGEAKLRMEMDAGDGDLLGMVKPLLRALTLPAMTAAMRQEEIAGPPAGPVLPPVPPPAPPPAGGQPTPGGPGAPPALAQALSNVNLSDILKNIHQMHLVVFTPPDGMDLDAIIQFSEKPFPAEGARRTLWIDADDTKILLMSFPSPPGGLAAIFATGGAGEKLVMALRTDGYPDLEPVGPMITMMLPLVQSLATGLGAASETAEETVPTPTPPHPTSRPARRPPRRPPAARRRPPPRRPVRRRTG